MKNLPLELRTAKNKPFGSDAWALLLDVTVTEDLHRRLACNNQEVTFEGNVYAPSPIRIDPLKQSSKGEIPTLSLKAPRIAPIIRTILRQYKGFVGCRVRLVIVYLGQLQVDYSQLETLMTIIDTHAHDDWVIFRLGPFNPKRMKFPPHTLKANHCNWRLGRAECGLSLSGETCARTREECARLSNSHYFGGHPGLNPKGWRQV